jgi:hypothetical protein
MDDILDISNEYQLDSYSSAILYHSKSNENWPKRN